jgi:hypothetical protein
VNINSSDITPARSSTQTRDCKSAHVSAGSHLFAEFLTLEMALRNRSALEQAERIHAAIEAGESARTLLATPTVSRRAAASQGLHRAP